MSNHFARVYDYEKIFMIDLFKFIVRLFIVDRIVILLLLLVVWL